MRFHDSCVGSLHIDDTVYEHEVVVDHGKIRKRNRWVNCRFEISDGVGTREVQAAKGAGADRLRGRAQANNRSAPAERASVRSGRHGPHVLAQSARPPPRGS